MYFGIASNHCTNKILIISGVAVDPTRGMPPTCLQHHATQLEWDTRPQTHLPTDHWFSQRSVVTWLTPCHVIWHVLWNARHTLSSAEYTCCHVTFCLSLLSLFDQFWAAVTRPQQWRYSPRIYCLHAYIA